MGTMTGVLRQTLSIVNEYFIPGAFEYAETIMINKGKMKNAMEYMKFLESEIDNSIKHNNINNFNETLKKYSISWHKIFERMAIDKYKTKGLIGMSLLEFRSLPYDFKVDLNKKEMEMAFSEASFYAISPKFKSNIKREFAIIVPRFLPVIESNVVYFEAGELIYIIQKELTSHEIFSKLCSVKRNLEGSWIDTKEALRRI
jgi:hypothetical protein